MRKVSQAVFRCANKCFQKQSTKLITTMRTKNGPTTARNSNNNTDPGPADCAQRRILNQRYDGIEMYFFSTSAPTVYTTHHPKEWENSCLLRIIWMCLDLRNLIVLQPIARAHARQLMQMHLGLLTPITHA